MTNEVHSAESLLNAKPEEPKIITNLRGVKNKIMVMSGKGGVGKSTVAANLAASLAQRGYNVGLLDADIHGPTIPKMFGIGNLKPKVEEAGLIPVSVSSNLKVMSIGFFLDDKDTPVIWRGPAKMGAIKQFLEQVSWGKLDFLIIDLPPGTGDEPLSIAQLIPDCDGAVVVTTPQDVALLSVRKSINFVNTVKIPIIGLVENMSGIICPHCNEKIDVFGSGGVSKAASDFGILVLGTLPIEPDIAAKGDSGSVFSDAEGKSEWHKNFEKIVDVVAKLNE
ncbi:MAG: Mrp/NBP35 family ATP-binding protein [Methanosarcinaceae archaeon]|nr:Mrp/NBP35 family ATP-binding protein [Methanosarcinaceae archaeon]